MPFGMLSLQVIQRKRKEFIDPQSRNNLARLNDDLADIHSIMKQNIEEVLNRGERLDRELMEGTVDCWLCHEHAISESEPRPWLLVRDVP